MLKKKGFTLIELLVVIAIIAILVVLIILALNAARMRARDSARKSDLRSVQTALELYNNDEESYPDAAGYGALKGVLEGGDYGFGIGDMPDDPNVQDVGYGYVGGNDYALGAELEGTDNIEGCPDGGSWEYCVGTDPDLALMSE
ncbi:type II secretion system protein [Patescibacteria group bacterium]